MIKLHCVLLSNQKTPPKFRNRNFGGVVHLSVVGKLCLFRSIRLLLNVGFFQSVTLFLVNYFQHKAQYQCSHTKASQHHEGSRVVVRNSSLIRRNRAVLQSFNQFGVRLVKHLTNEQGEEPQTDVLNPENQCVGTTDDFSINEFGHTGPQRSRYQREAGAQHQNGEVGYHEPATGLTLFISGRIKAKVRWHRMSSTEPMMSIVAALPLWST